MNYLRILRLTNLLFLFSGFHWHWFEQKTRRYRPSFLGVFHFVLLVILFVICWYQHFQQSPLLEWIHEHAPLLEKLIQLQLIIGGQVLGTLLLTMKSLICAANGFHELLPRNMTRTFLKTEAIAYVLLFATILLGFGFMVFILIELEFKLPTLNYLLFGGAIFLPHSIVACALKFFNIYTWFACKLLSTLETDVAVQLRTELTTASNNGTETETTGVINVVSCDAQLLLGFQEQLKQLLTHLEGFFDASKRSIWLFFMLNVHCFLGAAYSLVYYRNFWAEMFQPPGVRIFYAANIAIFVLIGGDYLCLLLLQNYLDKLRSKFILNLDSAIQQHNSTQEKATRRTLKNMRRSLKNAFQFKFSGGLRLTVSNFERLHFYFGIIIAITVIYYFLSDQILAVKKHLDVENKS